jgi:hypothetical protein
MKHTDIGRAAPFERHGRCVTDGPPTGRSGATPVSRPIRSDAARHLPTSVRRSKVANTMSLIPSNTHSRGPRQRLTRVPGCRRKHRVLRGHGVLSMHKQTSTANGGNEALMTTGGLRNDWIEMMRSFWCKCMHEAAMWPIHGWYRCRNCHRRHPVLWGSHNHYPAALRPVVQGGPWSNHVLPEVPK